MPKMMDDARKVLEILIPAIVKIDSGCPVCIDNFIEMANEQFERNGIPYRYVASKGWDPERSVQLRKEGK